MSNLTPWDSASEHCLTHIKRAMELHDVVKVLNTLSVAAVMPIVSSNHSTLLITPTDPSSLDNVRFFTRQAGQLAGVVVWKRFKSGEYWMLRGITPTGVQIDVTTSILNSIPQELDL